MPQGRGKTGESPGGGCPGQAERRGEAAVTAGPEHRARGPEGTASEGQREDSSEEAEGTAGAQAEEGFREEEEAGEGKGKKEEREGEGSEGGRGGKGGE